MVFHQSGEEAFHYVHLRSDRQSRPVGSAVGMHSQEAASTRVCQVRSVGRQSCGNRQRAG